MLASLDMKLYLKVVKFYYGLLLKVYHLIRDNPELTFLQNFQPKLYEFTLQRINYFISLKNITNSWPAKEFVLYLELIEFWENEDVEEITEQCQQIRANKI